MEFANSPSGGQWRAGLLEGRRPAVCGWAARLFAIGQTRLLAGGIQPSPCAEKKPTCLQEGRPACLQEGRQACLQEGRPACLWEERPAYLRSVGADRPACGRADRPACRRADRPVYRRTDRPCRRIDCQGRPCVRLSRLAASVVYSGGRLLLEPAAGRGTSSEASGRGGGVVDRLRSPSAGRREGAVRQSLQPIFCDLLWLMSLDHARNGRI